MRATLTAWILLAAVATLVACSEKEKSLCDRYTDRLRSCDIVTAGFVQCGDPDYDAHTRCDTNCLIEATCDELEQYACLDIITECMQTCMDTHGSVCADGMETIYQSWVCDGGEPDCSDGSDEVGCAMYDCPDGSLTIRETEVCDCFLDCDDGSDEEGCPPCRLFECEDGLFYTLYEYVCDGEPDCVDGSDEEVGCAELLCP